MFNFFDAIIWNFNKYFIGHCAKLGFQILNYFGPF